MRLCACLFPSTATYDIYILTYLQAKSVPKRLLAYIETNKGNTTRLPMLWACVRALRVSELESQSVQVLYITTLAPSF